MHAMNVEMIRTGTFQGTPRMQEVAAAILYLASPLAEMVSGTVIDVNGASFLRM